MKRELRWIQNLKIRKIQQKYFMTRYIDDILMIFAGINQMNQTTKIMLKLLEKEYSDQLKLLIEYQGNKVDFLETTITIRQNQINIKHKNKNYKYIMQGKGQKFLNLIHFNSFTEITQNIGVIIGTILRVAAIADTKTQQFKDINKIIIEFKFLNYPTNILKRAIRKIRSSKKDTELWTIIEQMI